MTTKKYKLTNECITVDGDRKLYRIQALYSFGLVLEGELGGFIENEDCLSHEGSCWVYDDAKVYDHSVVSGHARVKNNAIVCGHSTVTDHATVKDNAQVFRCCDIKDDSIISGNAIIKEDVDCFDDTVIGGNLQLSGIKRIYGQYVKHIDFDTGDTITYYIIDNTLVLSSKVKLVSSAQAKTQIAWNNNKGCIIAMGFLLVIFGTLFYDMIKVAMR